MLGAFLATWTLSAAAPAVVVYSNGFEPGDPGANDFYDSTTNVQGANITVVPSGGGQLHLTAASGGHYAEITNTDDAYSTANALSPGFGQSVYTLYGDTSGNGIPINGPFYQSTAYYINTNWAANPPADQTALWIDTTPGGDPNYLDETNFRLSVPGNGTVGVAFVGLNGTGSTTINSSGWYTFKITFEKDPATGNVLNNMSVSDSLGNLVGSYSVVSSLSFADLTGTNYGDWATVWDNGFANDVLGMDDVQVGTIVPEPASLSVLALGSLGLLARRRKHV